MSVITPSRPGLIEYDDSQVQIHSVAFSNAMPTIAQGQTLQPPPPFRPPDGGLHAWLKVLGGFMTFINIWGFTLAFGVFQDYYKSTLLSDSSASAISWIGTMQSWMLVVIGVLSGPLFDLGYFRPMLFTGNCLVVLGIMMLSLCKAYWQVFLSQGVCMGIGAGLLYVPTLALVSIWFEKKRALAMGIVTSGIAAGGVVYIMMFDSLIQSTTFAWTIRAIGFVSLGTTLIATPALLSGSSMLRQERKARALLDTTAFKDRLFITFTLTLFATYLGYIVPYFYIPTFARDQLHLSQSTALHMLVIAIGTSFFGRLASGLVAHHEGPIFTWTFCTLASGVLALAWIGMETEPSFIVFCVLWGFWSAALVTLPSAAFASITPDLSKLGTRLGMSMSFSSIGSLIGAPIGGSLLKHNDGNREFLGLQLWSGCCLMVGSVLLVFLWYSTQKRQQTGWKV